MRNVETPSVEESRQGTAVPVPVPAEIVPLHRVVEEALRDSRTDPERYLDETIVEHGGE